MILFEYGTDRNVLASSLIDAIEEFNLKYGTSIVYNDTYSVDGEYPIELDVHDIGYSLDEENAKSRVRL